MKKKTFCLGALRKQSLKTKSKHNVIVLEPLVSEYAKMSQKVNKFKDYGLTRTF